MLLTGSLLAILLLASSTSAEEKSLYHTLSKQQYFVEGLKHNALFGYSVTYAHYEGNKSLVVGSPKFNHQGNVFFCDIETKNCIKKFEDGELRIDDGFKSIDSWLGATVKAGPDFVTTCAPRCAQKSSETGNLGLFGFCYTLDLQNPEKFEKMLPIVLKEKTDYTKELYPLEERKEKSIEREMDSFGWSLHVDEYPLVGGPAMVNGRAMYYNADTPYLLKIQLRDAEFNFGYSITSGKFPRSAKYVVSSPYGTHGRGVVLFFDKKGKKSNYFQIQDYAPGSLYGGALATANLGGPYDSLLVGAPAWANDQDNTYDVGSVDVYTFENKNPKLRRVLTGYKVGGYFGSAIASVGDLTGDKLDEIAISAPYENNGTGAVYIYSGADLLKNESEVVHYWQKLEGEGPENYFGFSLSPLQDYDENGCNELAIGAPGHNRVTLYRCMAYVIVDIEADIPDLESQTKQLETKNATFIFKPCLKITRPAKPTTIESKFTVTVKINHRHVRIQSLDKPSRLVPELSFEVDLNDKPTDGIYYCKQLTVLLPSEGDYDVPIEIDISTKSDKNPLESTTFNPKLVLMDMKKSRPQMKVSKKIEFGSKLSFTVNETIRDNYLIGSSDTEKITIVVTNKGNTAYEPRVRLRLSGVDVNDKSTTCQPLDGEIMTCLEPSGIKRGQKWIIEIKLKTIDLTADKKSITIEAELFNHDTLADKKYTRTFNLVHDSIIAVRGSNSSLTVGKRNFIEYGSNNIEHAYTVTNAGRSRWRNIKCVIDLLPSTTSMVYVGKQACNVHGVKAECIIDLLKPNEPININVGIEVFPATPIISEIVDGKRTITTNLTIYYDDQSLSDSITTSLSLESAPIAIWIFIVAGLVGLLIILALAWALYECGCLRRKNKDELEKLKQDVRRQTVRRTMQLRQSMIEIVANQQAADRQNLLQGQDYTNDKEKLVDNRVHISMQEIKAALDAELCKKNINESVAKNCNEDEACKVEETNDTKPEIFEAKTDDCRNETKPKPIVKHRVIFN